MFFNYFFLFCLNLNLGQTLFERNCSMCHPNGQNLILAEKNLKKENLERNGLNSRPSLIYHLRNGKNGMAGFADRLTKEEIRILADYLIFQDEKNFENKEKGGNL